MAKIAFIPDRQNYGDIEIFYTEAIDDSEFISSYGRTHDPVRTKREDLIMLYPDSSSWITKVKKMPIKQVRAIWIKYYGKKGN
jgi:hypothetical protein